MAAEFRLHDSSKVPQPETSPVYAFIVGDVLINFYELPVDHKLNIIVLITDVWIAVKIFKALCSISDFIGFHDHMEGNWQKSNLP